MTTLKTSVLALLATLAVAPAATAGDGGFGAGENLPVGTPSAVAVGDFDDDGRADLLVAGQTAKRVDVFLQRAGGFTAGTSVTLASAPSGLAVADFDRDGHDDFVVSTIAGDVQSARGNGEGAFALVSQTYSFAGPVLSLVAGDFNGDARDDYAVATKTANGGGILSSRLGKGDGTFDVGPARDERASVLAVGEFDGNAIEDLALGGFAPSPSGSALHGSGTGLFNEPDDLALPARTASARALAVGDFDGDAAADVAAALESGAVAVRLGVGNGAFEPAPDVPAGTAPRAVAVADLDDDGDEDLVATDAGAGVVRVRLGDGTGRFSAAPDVPVGADPVDVAVADLNDDGVDDVAVAARGANALSVRPGTGVAALAGNLLQNGGFEGPAPTGKIQPIPAIAGWELEGAWYARYGHASHVYIPSWLAAPRYGTGGGRMLTGGYSAPTDGVTTATQEVDVSASAAAIDDDRARARLSAYLGGAGTHQDAMTARASFLDAGGTALDSLTIGPVRPADRRNATVLLRRAGTARIPRGTRRIRVTMTSFDADKTFSSATADDVKLTLATEPPAGAPTTPASSSDAPPPPPPPPAARFGPRTLVTVSLARRRLRPGRRLVLRVRNANAFAVAGSLRVAGRRRAIRVAARGAATVRLRLPARLRRRRVVVLRPVLVVRDPAGTSRRVTARLRVRITTRTKEVQS